MDERAFREKIRSNMKLNEQMRTVLPQHNELLDTLNNLEAMAIGQSDRIFCNSLGLSQILCKHRNAVQIEQNLFKAEVAQAAAALFSK